MIYYTFRTPVTEFEDCFIYSQERDDLDYRRMMKFIVQRQSRFPDRDKKFIIKNIMSLGRDRHRTEV